LYKSLDLNPPIFAHLPMILGPDKKRLSKRHGAPGVQSFADQGYFSDSILNYLALLGWNPKSEKEVMLKDELINGFSFQQVQKKGAVWDDKKLHWLSGQHVQNKTSQLLLEEIRLLESDWGKNADISQLINIIDALKPRAKSLQEFILKSKYFFISPESFDESEMLKAWPNKLTTEIVGEIEKVLISVESWYPEILEKQIKSFATKNSYGVGKVIMPLRLAVFGSLDGPSVFDIMSILGKSETLNRIHSAISRMSK